MASRSIAWRPTTGSVWEIVDPISGKILRGKVTHRFPTTEGFYVTLRDPKTDAPLGNFHASKLMKS